MQNRRSLEERRRSHRRTRYTRRDCNIRSCRPGSNLSKDIMKRHRFEWSELTRESPGEGLESVLRMRVSFSVWKGLTGRSCATPFDLMGCLIGNDHIPLAPPIACSLRFVRIGRSRCERQNRSRKDKFRRVF